MKRKFVSSTVNDLRHKNKFENRVKNKSNFFIKQNVSFLNKNIYIFKIHKNSIASAKTSTFVDCQGEFRTLCMPQYSTIAELQNLYVADSISLVKLQTVKTVLYKMFLDSYSFRHSWTAASRKLEKPNIGKALAAKSK